MFVQDRVFQHKPVRDVTQLVSEMCFYELIKDIAEFILQTYHTNKTTVKIESERVAASVWDMFASLVSTMVRLTRDAIVVHVAYMATPF